MTGIHNICVIVCEGWQIPGRRGESEAPLGQTGSESGHSSTLEETARTQSHCRKRTQNQGQLNNS